MWYSQQLIIEIKDKRKSNINNLNNNFSIKTSQELVSKF